MICCGLQSVKRVHVSILFFDLIYWTREANAHAHFVTLTFVGFRLNAAITLNFQFGFWGILTTTGKKSTFYVWQIW